jgi:hypothetical protein
MTRDADRNCDCWISGAVAVVVMLVGPLPPRMAASLP